ncbi:hypothetical protein IFM89_015040 [Coptis chinensis]|uniref:PB1-like domain-containing protein n=1 Tax=Coptis chinensis TaxID=261450 RepID=A0A835HI08_9MAGN|nr:hypothetical protein IFM89_015040 [Coptis chinensis]
MLNYSGIIEYVTELDFDRISYFELLGIVKDDLNIHNLSNMYWVPQGRVLQNNIHQILSDKETIEMVEYAKRTGVVMVYIEHNEDMPLCPIIEADVSSDESETVVEMEDESDQSDAASLDHISDVDEELLEVITQQLVSMKKKKKSKVIEDVNDNLDGNVNVDDVPTDGGGPSIEGLATMVDGNETDYASSDDHDSPEVSSEEDEMRPRNELKSALKDYVVATGCLVKCSINKASRMQARCYLEGGECPWRLWASPMQNEESFQIKTLVNVHKCSRNFNSRLANSQWLAKVYYDRIISNPGSTVRIDIDEVVGLAQPVFKRMGIANGNFLLQLGGMAMIKCFPLLGLLLKLRMQAVGDDLLIDDLRIVHGVGLTLITDQQKGLLQVINEMLPFADHRCCARHIYANLRKRQLEPSQTTMPPPSVQPSQETVSARVSISGKQKSKNIPESTPQPTMPPPSVQPSQEIVSVRVSTRGNIKSKNIPESTPQPTMPPPSGQPSQKTISARVSTRGKQKSKNIPESTPQPTMPPPSVQPSQDTGSYSVSTRGKRKSKNIPSQPESTPQPTMPPPRQSLNARNKTGASVTKTKTITECKSPTTRSMTSKQGATATKTRAGATKTKPNTVRPIWK